MGIYLVMKNNFKRSFNHKSLFAVMFLLPIILCLIAGSINFGKTSIRVGILGLDTRAEKEAFQNEIYQVLKQSEGVTYAFADQESMNTDLMSGRFHIILDYRGSSLPEDFKLITFRKEDKKELLTVMFQNALSKQSPIHLTGLKPKGFTVSERSIALLLTMFMILSTVQATMLIRDKQSGTFFRYQFVKKSGSSYIIGGFLHNLLITFGQILFCFTALLLIHKDFTLTVTQDLLLSALIAVIASVFSTLISLGSKSEVQANITASALTALLSLLGGTFVAVEAMPGLLRILSSASPVRWVIELLRII